MQRATDLVHPLVKLHLHQVVLHSLHHHFFCHLWPVKMRVNVERLLATPLVFHISQLAHYSPVTLTSTDKEFQRDKTQLQCHPLRPGVHRHRYPSHLLKRSQLHVNPVGLEHDLRL